MPKPPEPVLRPRQARYLERLRPPVDALRAEMEEVARRDDAFTDTLRVFRSAWARSDQADVKALGSEEFLAEKWYKVQDLLERRGWSDAFPPIDSGTTVGSNDDFRSVWFDLTPKGKLKTSWVFEDDRWRVARIVFSRTR